MMPDAYQKLIWNIHPMLTSYQIPHISRWRASYGVTIENTMEKIAVP